MRKHLGAMLIIAAVVAYPAGLYAETFATDSLEWMTVDCEVIVTGKVTAVTKTPDRGYSVYEDVTVTVSEVLKSDCRGTTIAFRWLTYSRKEYTSASDWQKSGHDMLFFLVKGDPERDKGRFKDRWTLRTSRTGIIDLDNPGKSAITADFKVLKESKDVLEAVRTRVSLIKKSTGKRKKWKVGREPSVFGSQQGFIRLIVPGTSQAWEAINTDSRCYLIVPPDDQYKTHAMRLCRSKDIAKRISGVQMLCNFHDKEVIELLKACLSDPGVSKWGSGGKIVKIVYPVRKAAYESLLTLGEKIEKPVLEQKPEENDGKGPENKKGEQKGEDSEKETLRILRKACVKNPDRGDVTRAENLFKNLDKGVALSAIKQVLSEDCYEDVPLWFIQRFIDDRSVIPAVVEIARKEKGVLRLRAVSIFRKIPDKRALPVLMEVLLHDDQKYYHRGELHDMYVTSIFINSAMAIHALTGGEVGIKPSKRDYVDSKAEAEIDKNKKEILEKCEKWWKANKKKVLEEIKPQEKQSRIEKAFELYRKGDTPQLLKQPHEVRIAVLKKALQDDSLRAKAVGLISYGRFDVKELAPEVITVAKEANGYLRWQAVHVIAEKMPDKRAVPVLIEHCLDDKYEDCQHWLDEHGGHEAMKSTMYETARALYEITKGEIGVKRSLNSYRLPSAVVLGLAKTFPDKARKWWAENKEEFLSQLKKEE